MGHAKLYNFFIGVLGQGNTFLWKNNTVTFYNASDTIDVFTSVKFTVVKTPALRILRLIKI